jgi:hypothetical protein
MGQLLDGWRPPYELIERETRRIVANMDTMYPAVAAGLQELKQAVTMGDDAAVMAAGIKLGNIVAQLGDFPGSTMHLEHLRRRDPSRFQEIVLHSAAAAAALEYARPFVTEQAHDIRVLATGLGMGLGGFLQTVTSRQEMLRACDVAETMWAGYSACWWNVGNWKLLSDGRLVVIARADSFPQ